MEKKNTTARPRRMNINVMRQIMENIKDSDDRGHFFMNKDFGVANGMTDLFRAIIQSSKDAPLIVEDYRMGILLKGELDADINLRHMHYTEGDMVFLSRGSIAQLNYVSQKIEVRGFVLSEDMINRLFPQRKPEILNGMARIFSHHSSQSDRDFIISIAQAAWNLIRSDHFNDDSIDGIFHAVIHYYNNIYLQQNEMLQSGGDNRQRDIFNEFLSLVNKYVTSERNLTFYADKLCLSQRYLSTVVSEQSGQTAKHWIDQATIARAKAMLRHTTMSVSQISDQLHFPNDSFFCKYFRRLTDVSPSKYRAEGE